MAKEPNPIAPKANTEVTIIVMIDSSLIIENDLTLENITIPALCDGFLNRECKMDTQTGTTYRPPSLFSAENSV
jgi:hypothetical protein